MISDLDRSLGSLTWAKHDGHVRPKEYGVLAVLLINRVTILTILVSTRVWFLHSSLEFRMHLFEATCLLIIN